MTTTVAIQGHCDSRFSLVKEAFAANFAAHGEVGAAVAVMVEGRMVVDLWAGYCDAERTRPWQRDTIVNLYSTTKGMTTVCAHRLVDQGLLDIDAPVAKYWPEFAQAGKEDIPVRYLLSHQAGLPAVREILPKGALYDWDTMTSALAAEEPWWEPGAKHGYHAITFGFLVGEVIRRVAGMTVGQYFRREIAGPLGLDFHIGLTPADAGRVADMVPSPFPELDANNPLAKVFADPNSMSFKAFVLTADLMGDPLYMNKWPWRSAELPAANGHGNARSLAKIYGALAMGGQLDGVRVLSPEAIERAAQEQCYGEDAVMVGFPSRFGLGFALPVPETKLARGDRVFGHGGMGGSQAFADPDAKLGFGYTMNKMLFSTDPVDPRQASLINAVYDCL